MSEDIDDMEPIRAERQTVRFFDGLEVDGYRMPNGEFRVGLASASRVIGFDRDWLSDVIKGQTPRTLKALQDIGFSENIRKVSAQSNQGNWLDDRTIGLDDFNSCIIYGTQRKRLPAIALNKSFTRLSLLDFFRDAFGEPPLSIKEKRRLFYEMYAATISPDDWRKMDRQDILRLALPGDESHLKDGRWNQWDDEE